MLYGINIYKYMLVEDILREKFNIIMEDYIDESYSDLTRKIYIDNLKKIENKFLELKEDILKLISEQYNDHNIMETMIELMKLIICIKKAILLKSNELEIILNGG